MPSAHRNRTIAAPRDDVWALVADPHHLPRWWPRVIRVEGVEDDAFTTVLKTDKGRDVRADYKVIESDPPSRRRWSQEIEGSPFEGILARSETEVTLAPADGATQVTLALRQRLRGLARLGGFMVRRAAGRQLDEALDGLELVLGR